jgi:phycobilisome rod-core linker protein
MSLPLLDYKPSSQNQRVSGYEVPGEDTPRTYRIEDCLDSNDVLELIWAAYRQVFSEHEILQSNRQTSLESQLKNRAINVRDFVRGLTKSEALGWGGFVDTLLDSQEYQESFGENTVPYQRRRYKGRPFNLVTPRYSDYWRDKLESDRYKWGDVNNFLEMARAIKPRAATNNVTVDTANIKIPDMTRDKSQGVPVSISPAASFPLR